LRRRAESAEIGDPKQAMTALDLSPTRTERGVA
jgi:hypothetical protein